MFGHTVWLCVTRTDDLKKNHTHFGQNSCPGESDPYVVQYHFRGGVSVVETWSGTTKHKNARSASSSFWNTINIPLLFLTLKIFMDVDCSTITYETPPSSAVLSAVEKAKAELASVASNLTQETLERWERKRKTACVCQIFIGTTQDSDEGGEPGKLAAEADRPKKQHCRSDQGGLLQRHWCFQLWIFGKMINLTTHGKLTWRR